MPSTFSFKMTLIPPAPTHSRMAGVTDIPSKSIKEEDRKVRLAAKWRLENYKPG